jgi:branched-chain amino acid transport system permease protein
VSGSAILLQFLNGLAAASSLFLVAAGLSLIFGVTRIVNFAHGSLYMLGMYLAVWLSGKVGFWAAIPLAAAAVGAFGFVVEVVLLRRIYRAPELFQLLATSRCGRGVRKTCSGRARPACAARSRSPAARSRNTTSP